MTTYADRPWVKQYDKGVPNHLEYPEVTLDHFLKENARQIPNNTALITSARLPLLGRVSNNTTYKELDEASDALAVALIEQGLKKGDRVAIVMPNSVAFAISYHGIMRAGGVVAATNPTYPIERMAQQINDSDAEFVICMSLFYNVVKQIKPKTKVKHVIVANYKEYLPGAARFLFTLAREKKDGHYVEQLEGGDSWFQDLLTRYAGQQPKLERSPDDVALFQYTGGTTGISKAAISTHRALVANAIQQATFITVDNIPGENEIFLGAIPMFHVFGMVSVLTTAIYMKSKVALVPNARDLDDLLDTIDIFKPTLFHAVPALYNAINNHPKVKAGQIDLSSIRLCVSGSAPLPPAVKREFERLSGGVILEGFGMSEAPTASHVNPVQGGGKEGSIGVPLPDVDVKIVSLDDGITEVAVGDPGEMIIAAPNLMKGYHGMPTETQNTLREIDGRMWLYTGDIARMDEDGFFYIVDRKKDMALIGGFNVYPTAVEKVLKEHPAVLEVGVAAIPHPEKSGQEALKAWIVLKPGQKVGEEELIKHCEQHLAPYEIPRRISFIDELPKTTVGKTLRRELVRMETE